MHNQENTRDLPVSDRALRSTARAMESLRAGTYQEQHLTDTAVPYARKQPAYLASYARLVRSRNYRYILECRGED